MSDDALIESMVWAAIDSRKLPEGTLVNYTTFKADMTAALAALRKTHETVRRDRIQVLSSQQAISQNELNSHVLPRNKFERALVLDAAQAIVRHLESDSALKITKQERDGAFVVRAELMVITPLNASEATDA